MNGDTFYPTNWIFKMKWVKINQVWPSTRKRGIYDRIKDIKTHFVCIVFLIVHLKVKHIVLEIKSKLCSGMDEIGALIIEITTTKPRAFMMLYTNARILCIMLNVVYLSSKIV